MICIRVSVSWGKGPRRRSKESAGGAGRLFGEVCEVCEDVLMGEEVCSVNTVVLGETVESGVVLGAWEEMDGH